MTKKTKLEIELIALSDAQDNGDLIFKLSNTSEDEVYSYLSERINEIKEELDSMNTIKFDLKDLKIGGEYLIESSMEKVFTYLGKMFCNTGAVHKSKKDIYHSFYEEDNDLYANSGLFYVFIDTNTGWPIFFTVDQENAETFKLLKISKDISIINENYLDIKNNAKIVSEDLINDHIEGLNKTKMYLRLLVALPKEENTVIKPSEEDLLSMYHYALS